MARWINDEWRQPNCTVKKVVIGNNCHLCIFALTDIPCDSELRYDYGDKDLPWRKQVKKKSPNVLHELAK